MHATLPFMTAYVGWGLAAEDIVALSKSSSTIFLRRSGEMATWASSNIKTRSAVRSANLAFSLAVDSITLAVSFQVSQNLPVV